MVVLYTLLIQFSPPFIAESMSSSSSSSSGSSSGELSSSPAAQRAKKRRRSVASPEARPVVPEDGQLAQPQEQRTVLTEVLSQGVTRDGLRRSLDLIHRMDPAFRALLSVRVGGLFVPLSASMDIIESELAAREDEPLVVPSVPVPALAGDQIQVTVTTGPSAEAGTSRTVKLPTAEPSSGVPLACPGGPIGVSVPSRDHGTLGEPNQDAPVPPVNPTRGTSCGICGTPARDLRAHVEREHLPWFFNPVAACFHCSTHHRNQTALQRHVEATHGGMEESSCMLGGEGNYHRFIMGMIRLINGLMQACGFVAPHQLSHVMRASGLSPRPGTHVQGFWQQIYADLASAMDSPLSGRLTLNPPNHPVAALHWESMHNILAHLQSRELVRDVLSCPDSFDVLLDFSDEKSWPRSVDAHCHLRVAASRSGQELSTVAEQWAAGVVGHHLGAVVDNRVFLDHDWRGPFPQEFCVRSLAGGPTVRVYYTFGIHPREPSYSNDTRMRWQTLVSDPRCVGIGEVGLDRTCPPDVWPVQSRVLGQAASLAREQKKPLVLHMRPGQGVLLAGLQEEVIGVLRSAGLPARHPIHLHCYTGSKEEYHVWMKAFPCSRVGISMKTMSTPGGRTMVRNVDLECAMLETDCPYLGASPWDVHRVAVEVGKLRNLPTRVILSLSANAARCLYGIVF